MSSSTNRPPNQNLVRPVLLSIFALCFWTRGSCAQVPFASAAAENARAADTASMPPSCRVHGGLAPVRPAPPIFKLAQRVDRQLDSLGLGEAWIRLYAVHGGAAIDAGYSLEPYGRTGAIERVDTAWVRMREPAATYWLKIVNGTNDWRDSIRVRRGFADTLVIGFGHLWMCHI